MTSPDNQNDGFVDADRPLEMQPRSSAEEVRPPSASADGTLNSHCIRCNLTGQGMAYAACLWRQDLLVKPDVRIPTDWLVCREAAQRGTCKALDMRREEQLAGKAIYFRPRSAERAVVTASRTWSSAPTRTSAPTPRPPARRGDALDALADATDMSAVATLAAQRHEEGRAPAPTPAPATPAASPVLALPGETPLQMALRLRAARAAT